ncbi:MAG: zinc-ribbon domain-containing protein [Terriglobales bacterium]|jgi:uncharacterized membrane protein
MPHFCPSCGSQVQDNVAFCPSCGKPTGQAANAGYAAPAATPAVPAVAAGGGMADNVAGMLAYITIIPAIMFLVMEPYNKKSFVRFHSFQSIFFCVAIFVLWIAAFIFSMVLAFIPILGHLVALLIWLLLWVGVLIVWVVLLIKANQGQMWKVPFIGDMAEKQANVGQ